jgi:hypothetical protein
MDVLWDGFTFLTLLFVERDVLHLLDEYGVKRSKLVCCHIATNACETAST